ncbi:MAG: T9SS type A sorting domain-containing protein, partial [Bacteroidia bacterium]
IAFYKGQGNSNRLTNYQHLDKDILDANTSLYYRLWQQDFDGRKTDLGIKMLQAEDLENEILVYPNPASENIWIKASKEKVIDFIELHSVDGKLIKTWSRTLSGIGSAPVQLQVTGLNPGVYILQFKTENQILVKKIYIR